jgi:hypothetical protein
MGTAMKRDLLAEHGNNVQFSRFVGAIYWTDAAFNVVLTLSKHIDTRDDVGLRKGSLDSDCLLYAMPL